MEIKRNKIVIFDVFFYGAKLSYGVRRDFKLESSLAVVRDTAVVLKEEPRSSAAYSNNACLALVLVKARTSAAT